MTDTERREEIFRKICKIYEEAGSSQQSCPLSVARQMSAHAGMAALCRAHCKKRPDREPPVRSVYASSRCRIPITATVAAHTAKEVYMRPLIWSISFST